MGGVGTGFGLQAFTDAFRLYRRRELGRLGRAKAHADPEHAGQPAPLERPELPHLHRECARRRRLDAARDADGGLELEVAEKPDREVKVLQRRPPELRRQHGLRLHVLAEPRPMLVRDRQSEESPNS